MKKHGPLGRGLDADRTAVRGRDQERRRDAEPAQPVA